MNIILFFLSLFTLGILFLAWRFMQPSKPNLIAENSSMLTAQQALAKRLRHALYWAERHEQQALEEIQNCYLQQKEILEELGRPTYLELPSKTLFFRLSPFGEGQHIYYYQRDLKETQKADYREESLRLLQEFDQQRKLLGQQILLFQELQKSHQENLHRLEALKKGDQSWAQLDRHRQYLAHQKAQDKKEEVAILQQYRLELITEELEFQEDCQQAYEALIKEDCLAIGPQIDQLRAKVEQQDPDRG